MGRSGNIHRHRVSRAVGVLARRAALVSSLGEAAAGLELLTLYELLARELDWTQTGSVAALELVHALWAGEIREAAHAALRLREQLDDHNVSAEAALALAGLLVLRAESELARLHGHPPQQFRASVTAHRDQAWSDGWLISLFA